MINTLDTTTLQAHINYISKLLTDKHINHATSSYNIEDEVPYIIIETEPSHYLYFYRNKADISDKPAEIRLHNDHLANHYDNYFPYDDLANPLVYNWLIEIIQHIIQTNQLIKSHRRIPF